MKLKYEYFRGTLISWQSLFAKAAEFASNLPPERIVNISHSSDHNDGIVTVWYWAEE